MSDFENFEIPNEEGVSTEDLRDELLSLSEKGEINYAPKYIQKANRDALEKIKRKYDRKQLEITNEFISNIIISKLADTLDQFGMVDSSSELGQELDENQMFKKEVKNLVGDLTPYIPRVGLMCGGLIVGKHVINKRRKTCDEMKGPPDVDLGF